MNAARSDNSVPLRVAGTIHHVDSSSRELTLLVNGERTELVVPPDCLVRLNGERVKLRLLQPGDQAEVAYSFVGPTAFAHSIQVNWLPRVAALSQQQKGERGAAPSTKNHPGSPEILP
jgi:hypothetical protein